MDSLADGGYPVYGAQVQRPLKIRMLQYASLILALAGLVLLYLFSVSRDIPFIRIGSITPAMNFACVRLSGEVTRDAYVFKSGGLIFDITDGSGEIAVAGGRAQAEVLSAAGKLPRRGDRIEISGSLNVSAGRNPQLRLQSSDHLVLSRKHAAEPGASAPVRLADINASRRGKNVSVEGVLKSVEIPGPGSRAPYTLMLEENGAELAVVFWEDVFQDMDQILPAPGKRLRVNGRVDVYKDTVQLKVQDAAGVRVSGDDQK